MTLLLAIAGYHLYGAAYLLFLVKMGKTTAWDFFFLVDCCDIPVAQIYSKMTMTAGVAIFLALALGKSVLGLKKFQKKAWWSSFAFCLLLMCVHLPPLLSARAGIDSSFSLAHLPFVLLCGLIVLLLILSIPLSFDNHSREYLDER